MSRKKYEKKNSGSKGLNWFTKICGAYLWKNILPCNWEINIENNFFFVNMKLSWLTMVEFMTLNYFPQLQNFFLSPRPQLQICLQLRLSIVLFLPLTFSHMSSFNFIIDCFQLAFVGWIAIRLTSLDKVTVPCSECKGGDRVLLENAPHF